MRLNGGDHPGSRGMNRQSATASAGQRLAFGYPITGFDAKFAFRTQMLLQWDNKALSKRQTAQWHPA